MQNLLHSSCDVTNRQPVTHVPQHPVFQHTSSLTRRSTSTPHKHITTISVTYAQAIRDAAVLSSVAKQHILAAWFAGGMMAWLAESYRRRTFAGQELARLAHDKELQVKSRHLSAQQELAVAREEVRSYVRLVVRSLCIELKL